MSSVFAKKWGDFYKTGLESLGKYGLENPRDYYHFKEEQRAYYQGLINGVLLMDGLGLLRENVKVKELIR